MALPRLPQCSGHHPYTTQKAALWQSPNTGPCAWKNKKVARETKRSKPKGEKGTAKGPAGFAPIGHRSDSRPALLRCCEHNGVEAVWFGVKSSKNSRCLCFIAVVVTVESLVAVGPCYGAESARRQIVLGSPNTATMVHSAEITRYLRTKMKIPGEIRRFKKN